MTAQLFQEIRSRFYLDSVALMQMSREIASMDGVEEAAMMMGTPSNQQIMFDAGLLPSPESEAGGGDLIIAVRAEAKAGAAALAHAKQLLEAPAVQKNDDGAQWRPRSLRSAVKQAPGANLALISVSGDFAVAEARKAIRRGLHAMIFSDNVPIEDEVALKLEAVELGRLVMGPDCGTAIINGAALAFANKVPRGDIGIVGASGTGIQEVSCLIAKGGKGISHAIGVGGRDLKQEVGGLSTLMAIDALEDDPGTRHIVLISKPPARAVAEKIVDHVGAGKKNYTLCFVGADEMALPENAVFTSTLKAAAQSALGQDVARPKHAAGVPAGTKLRGKQAIGLFSGGTLCAEAQVIFRNSQQAVSSNVPIPGVLSLGQDKDAHPMIDLGDDDYTRGKPHPMIDPSVRDDALKEALENPRIGVILMDLVLGYGAHSDPAGILTAVLAEGPADRPVLIASVTGTDQDYQGLAAQSAKLEAAGVLVAPSNADACERALACLHAED